MDTQNRSNCQNTPLTDDEINRTIETAEKSRDSFQYIWLLSGIVLQDKVEVFSSTYLLPFPSSLGKKGEKIPHYVSKWSSTAGGIECF